MPSCAPNSTRADAAQLIAARKLSPVEYTDSFLHRIGDFDPQLNAFVIVETPGGGGHGDPRLRTAVAEDIANGKVSVQAAREAYGQVG